MKKLLRLMLLAALFVPLGATAQTPDCTTAIVVTSSTPFFEGFEGASMPDCWTTDGPGSWSVGVGDYSTSTGSATGTGNAKITHGTTNDVTKLITPMLDISGLSGGAQLSFQQVRRDWAGDFDELSVYYRTSTTDAWVLLQAYSTAVETWTEEAISLSLTATTVQFAFEFTDHYGYGCGIDDVTVGPPPSCFPLSSLTATTVSSTEINLAWTDADNTGASYQIAYVAAGSTDTVTLSPVTGTSYTVTGLTPVTTYTFIVTPICSDGDAVPSTATAMTDCAEGSCYYVFDMHDRYGDGWNGNAFEVYQNSSLMGTATIISGDYGLDSVRVCNTTDPATLRIVYISGSSANEMSGYINAGAGRIFDISTITSYANGAEVFSSDVTCPSCVSPVVSDSIDDDGNIVLTWTGDASQYIVYMGDSIVDDNVSANEITLTDIPASTILQLSVQAVCGADDTSYATIVSVMTPCGAIEALPYTTDFEEDQNNEIPLCWNVISGSDYYGAPVPSVYNAGTYSANSGTNVLRLSGKYGDDTNLIVTPPIVVNPAALHIGFSVYPYFGYGGNFYAGLMSDTNDFSTFVPMLTLNSSNSTGYTYTDYEFYTDTYTAEEGDTAFLAFVFIGGSNNSNSYVYVEDLFIKNMPACRPPFVGTGVIDSVTYHSAYFAWQGQQGASFDVMLTHYNFDSVGTPVDTIVEHFTADTTFLTINTLLDSTVYYASVATVCDEDTTDYLDLGTFLTHNRSYPVVLSRVNSVTNSAASIAWSFDNRGIAPTGTLVTLYDLTDPTVSPVVETLPAATRSKVYSSLAPNHTYKVELLALCGPSDTARARNLFFTTHVPGCVQYYTDAEATNSSSTSPYYYYSTYAGSQTIYHDSVLNGLDTLSGIAYNAYFTNTTYEGLTNYTVDIYLKLVDTADLTAYNGQYYLQDFIPVDNTMAKVVSNYTFSVGSNGWVYIPFDSTYAVPAHDGGQRVMVTLVGSCERESSSQYNYWRGKSESATDPSWQYYYKSRYFYTSNAPIDPTQTRSSNGSSYVPNIQFFGNCAAGCYAPSVALDSYGSDNVTVSWFANGEETSWLVEYKAATDSVWTVAGTATASPYTVNGLTPSTAYQVRVGAICTDDTVYAVANFQTPCAITLPYTANFVTPDPCWTLLSSTSTSENGYNLYSSRAMISPEMPVSLDTLMLLITDRCYSTSATNQTYAVYACNADGSGRELISVVTATTGSNFGVNRVLLAGYTGTKTQFLLAPHNGGDVYILNIEVSIAPACMAPDVIVLDSVSVNSISISWTDDFATRFRVSYRPADDTTSAWTHIDTAAQALTIPGLTPGTRYEVALYAYCPNGALSNATIDYFATDCHPLDVPYTTYFAEMPVCWSTYTSGAPQTSWAQSAASAASNNYLLSAASSLGAPANDWLITPAFNIPASAATLSYNFVYQIAGITGSASDAVSRYQLLVSPTGSSSVEAFTDTILIDTLTSSTFDFRRIPLAAYAGQTVRFAIQSLCNRSSLIGIYEAAIRNIDAPYYYMNGDAAVYMGDTGTYYVTRIEGDTTTVPTYTWTSNMIAAGQATLINVSGDTVRIAYSGSGRDTVQCVISNAFGADTNRRVVTVIDVAPVNIFPYATGFETSDTDNDNWILFQGSTNRWIAGNATNNGGSRSLYISNTGTTNAYDGNVATYSYAVRALDLTPGNYNISFDWKCNGESNYDYLRAWIAPGTATFAANVGPGGIELNYSTYNSSPAGWVDLNGSKMNLNGTTWTTVDSTVSITDAGRYFLVFLWHNDGSDSNQPPAAIDNIAITTNAAQPECHTPAFVNDTIGENDYTFNFSGDADNFEVAIIEGVWNDSTSAATLTPVATTDTFYTFTDLTANTTYSVAVRAVCGDNFYSDWAVRSITTLEHPCFVPTAVTVSDISFDAAVIGWTPGESETQWEVNVTGPSYDQTFNANTNPYTLTGLASNETYTVRVRALCSETQQSDWSETAQFTTERCQPVTGVTATATTFQTATVSWNPASNGSGNYEVEYGLSGFRQGDGTRVTVNGATTYTIAGLDSETNYDVYVRSICSASLTSSWSTVATFTTPDAGGTEQYTVTVNYDQTRGTVIGAGTYYAGTQVTLTATSNPGYRFAGWSNGEADSNYTFILTENVTLTANFEETVGIDDVDATSVSLYPNPATTTVTLTGLEPGAKVTIVDLNGREISKFKIQNSKFEIDVTSLASGAYYVRITGQRQQAVRKLIVK